jgi:hypothetical protein
LATVYFDVTANTTKIKIFHRVVLGEDDVAELPRSDM